MLLVKNVCFFGIVEVITLKRQDNSDFLEIHLSAREVAERLHIALSTLNSWLQEDDGRPKHLQVFQFFRWRGSRRIWSQDGYRQFEEAVHQQSQGAGILARRCRAKAHSRNDTNAQAALEHVLQFPSR